MVCRTRDRSPFYRHHHRRTNLSRCITTTIVLTSRSGGNSGARGDGGRSRRRQAQRAERAVQLHVARKAAPDVSLAAGPVPREPVRGAAARRRSGGPHPLPLQSFGSGEVQAVCIEVRPLRLVRAGGAGPRCIPPALRRTQSSGVGAGEAHRSAAVLPRRARARVGPGRPPGLHLGRLYERHGAGQHVLRAAPASACSCRRLPWPRCCRRCGW